MKTFNFNSKETYLVARAEWKADYKEISQSIRDARTAYREAAQAFSKCDRSPYGDNHKQYWAAWYALDAALTHLSSQRMKANELLFELVNMKEKAQIQWEADRASTCV